MPGSWWIAAAVVMIGAAVAAVIAAVVHWGKRADSGEAQIALAREMFRRQREWLEARFLTLASQSGKPRGLAWVNCEFENAVSFARDRQTGELRALVGVTISFEAIEGGGMEDNENVGNLRAATAIFRLSGNQWLTEGRAVFNLNPAQAIQHFHHELETVD
jgi:hypothetical protein